MPYREQEFGEFKIDMKFQAIIIKQSSLYIKHSSYISGKPIESAISEPSIEIFLMQRLLVFGIIKCHRFRLCHRSDCAILFPGYISGGTKEAVTNFKSQVRVAQNLATYCELLHMASIYTVHDGKEFKPLSFQNPALLRLKI
jgi:hypothetical protein